MRIRLAGAVLAGALAVATIPLGASASAAASNARCDTLQRAIEQSTSALLGTDKAGERKARRIARQLRALARGELTPEDIRPSLRTLAKLYDRVGHGAGVTDLIDQIGDYTEALADVVEYVAKDCPAAGDTTTTTTSPSPTPPPTDL
jgi:hypothetical protein